MPLGEVEELVVQVEHRVFRNHVDDLADEPVELETVAVVEAFRSWCASPC